MHCVCVFSCRYKILSFHWFLINTLQDPYAPAFNTFVPIMVTRRMFYPNNCVLRAFPERRLDITNGFASFIYTSPISRHVGKQSWGRRFRCSSHHAYIDVLAHLATQFASLQVDSGEDHGCDQPITLYGPEDRQTSVDFYVGLVLKDEQRHLSRRGNPECKRGSRKTCS